MWIFNYDETDFFKPENKKQVIVENLWSEVKQRGESPGKIKAYAI